MRAEYIVDASVIAAALFPETHSETARTFLADGPLLAAPDLLPLEIASIAAKKVWRQEIPLQSGQRALHALSDFVAHFAPAFDLAERAFSLAAIHKFSAYDAAYLALSERLNVRLMTLDRKLVRRAEDAGLIRQIECLAAN